MWQVLQQIRDAVLAIIPLTFLKLILCSTFLLVRAIFGGEADRKVNEQMERDANPEFGKRER